MNARMRAVTLVMALGMLGALLAAPAAAETEGRATFAGTASVGKWFATVCDKNGLGQPTGRGLYLPGTVTVPGVSNGDDTREEQGTWQFSTTGSATGRDQAGELNNSPFELKVCGWLSATVPNDPNNRFDGVGASCGSSKGHHGQGNVLFSDSGQRIKLFNVGWKASAGGTLPVTGSYQEYAGAGTPEQVGNTKKDKFGALMAEVQAQGGLGCLGTKTAATNNGNGAQQFTVAGVAQFTNGTPGPTKTDPKTCKGTGPAAGMEGVKKSHANKPGPQPCPTPK